MTKIVFLDAKTVGEVPNFRVLEKQGTLTIYEKTLPSEVLGRCGGQDVVITSKVLMSSEILSKLPDLKLICVAATGMDNIDLEAARKRNIQVKNVAGYSTESVAQLTFAMLLYLVNRIQYYDNYIKSGAYPNSDIFTHFGPAFWELKAKQLGIIGLGNIGRRVAQIAQSFGMEVVFFSTTGKNNNIRYKRFDLDTLLSTSDVVSIHAPLNDKTRGLINYNKILLMRSCAILLNTGRGGIINESDLARALRENLIGGAGIDVLEQEPPSADNPLFKLPEKEKLLITPHIAWTSIEARQRLIEMIAVNIEEFRKSKY